MTHAAYLCAKLNEKTTTFDTGRGGRPNLTQQDIAGAIAFVKPGLGRELMLAVWWPAGAALTAGELEHLMIGAQLGEFRERMEALTNAQIREYMERGLPGHRAAVEDKERAIKHMWPAIDDRYQMIRRAVLKELKEQRKCQDCSGTFVGASVDGEEAPTCVRCSGTGKVDRGPVWRAEQLGMKHSSFLSRWKEPYEWLLEHCLDKLRIAERQLSRATSD